jgi:hypothetical protein
MADAHNDRWLDLIERFAARGADIRVGDLQPGMIRHLLDTVEEQDVRIRGLEDGHRRLLERIAKLERGDGPPS